MREARQISRSKDLEQGDGEQVAETRPQRLGFQPLTQGSAQIPRKAGSGRDHSGATEKPRKL
jgi:hypothetical protein